MKIYAGDLADIGQAQLAVAFRRARHECRFFPKIAELREFAGASEAEDCATDRAWNWITRYIRRHGTGGETIYHFSNPERVVLGEDALSVEVSKRQQSARDEFRAEHPDVPYEERAKIKFDVEEPREVPAPEIPLFIRYALAQLAFDMTGGLERIEATRDDPAAAGWVRKEFGEAYRRARSLWEQALVARLTAGCEAPAIEETKESCSSLRLN